MCSAIPRRIAVIGSSCSPAPRRRLRGCGGAAGQRGAAAGRAGCGGGRRRGAGAGASSAVGAAAGPPRRRRGCPSSSRGRRGRCPAPGQVDAVLGGDPRDDGRDERLAVPLRRPSASSARGGGGRGGAARLRGARRRAPTPSLAARHRSLGGASCVAGAGGSSAARRRALRPRARSRRASSRPRPSRPPATRICWRTPVPGLGTSVSTLSVEISSSGSSASTVSPSCLSHFVIVPSETDTPICGMTTSTAVPVAILPSTPPAPCSPATTSSTCGMNAFSSGGENGTGRVGRGDPLHRARRGPRTPPRRSSPRSRRRSRRCACPRAGRAPSTSCAPTRAPPACPTA